MAWKLLRRLFSLVGCLLAAAVVIAAGLVAWLTVTEYMPSDVTELEAGGGKTVSAGETLTLLTFNTGYAGLDKTQDFFMDGGKSVNPDSREEVESNLSGISEILISNHADFYFLQEVDADSSRTYHIDELEYYEAKTGLSGAYAINYKCAFVPYPVPFIGKVESGLTSLTEREVSEAQRVSLPVPFKWPVRVANLKRCMLVERLPIEGSDAQLVLINVHLEAYDGGEGKAAQTEALLKLAEAEYSAGNYVVIGGDFNQTFEGAETTVSDPSFWQPGDLMNSDLAPGWSYVFDKTTATCRLLNRPYEAGSADTQLYVIDGFVVSPNVAVSSVVTLDEGFEYSDHNPVKLTFRVGD